MTRARDLADRNFADNDKVVLGSGDDLEISHNATNSIIENKTGYLALRSQDGGQIRIEDASGNANALFNDNSDVKLRYNASDRLVTTSAGVTVTGNVTLSGTVDGRDVGTDGTKLDGIATSATAVGGSNGVDFNDNVKVRFGTGNDYEMYWDGSDGYLTESGSGGIYIGADSTIAITNAAVSENKAQFITNGAVKLFYDNAEKIATTSSGVSVTGTVAATAFTGDGSALTGLSSAISNTPVVTARKGANQNLSRGVFTKITGFTSSEYDSDSAWDGSRFTVPSGKGGRYLISCHMTIRS